MSVSHVLSVAAAAVVFYVVLLHSFYVGRLLRRRLVNTVAKENKTPQREGKKTVVEAMECYNPPETVQRPRGGA